LYLPGRFLVSAARRGVWSSHLLLPGIASPGHPNVEQHCRAIRYLFSVL